MGDSAPRLGAVQPGASSFEAIYDEHHDFVWRSLRALGVPARAVDDVTQDVFITVHRKLHAFDPNRPVRAWLFGIARNFALRHGERNARRPPALHLLVDPPSDDISAERRVELSEAAALVRVFLEQLDEDKRAVFVLCELEGATAPEAAEALNVKLNTIYSRLRVARDSFSKTIARAHARQQRRAR